MATFKEALSQLPATKLQTIMLNRQIDLARFSGIKAKEDLTHYLATELARSASVMNGAALCNAHHLQFLQVCVTLQKANHVAWKRLVEHIGGAEVEPILLKTVGELTDFGLAILYEKEVYLQNGIEEVVPSTLSERYQLESCLNNHDAQSVQKIAANLGVKVVKPLKANHVKGICEILLAPDIKERLTSLLSPEDRDLLEYIRLNDGSVPADEVVEPASGVNGYFYRHNWHSNWKNGIEDTSVDRLLARGLIFTTWQGYSYELQVVIPGDLLKALTGKSDNSFWLNMLAAPIPLPTPPNSISTPPNLVRDVTAFLGYLQSQECVRTGTGLIHRTALKNATRYLQYPDEMYTSFLYCLCREADFLYVSGEKQVYGVNEKGRSWLYWDTKTQLRVLFEAWRHGVMWGEMYIEPVKKGSSSRSIGFMSQVRGRVLSLITETDTTEFLNAPIVRGLFTFRCAYLVIDSQRGPIELVPTQSILARCLIEECLYWLGLVEIGWDAAQAPAIGSSAIQIDRSPKEKGATDLITPVGYRLTPLGRWLLKEEKYELSEPPREEQFVLQANGEAFASPYISPAMYYKLLNFAEFPLKGAQTTHPVVTKESLRRAIDRGDTVQTTLDFLSTSSRVGVPQNIAYLINEVGGKHGHIHVGKATLYIQVDSPLLLQELQARKEFKSLFHRTLSDTIALLNGEDIEKTLKELRKAGYLPVSDEEAPLQAMTEKFHPKPPPSIKEDVNIRKIAAYRQKLEKAIDWKRIALGEIGHPSSPVIAAKQTPPQMPTGAQAAQQVVRFLVMQSINLNKPLEIAMESATPNHVEVLLVQPTEVQGDVVVVYNLQQKTHFLVHLAAIHWARMVK